MLLLPKWILTKGLPAYMDAESGTFQEQVYKIYGKMNELIEEYNKFVDDANKTITDHVNQCNEDHEVFATALRQEFKDFIDVVELKLMDIRDQMKDAVLDDIVEETSNEIREVVNDTMTELRALVDGMINDADQTIDDLVVSVEEMSEHVDEMLGAIQQLQQQAITLENAKADITYVDNKVKGLANANSVYTKAETNGLLNGKANANDVYNKSLVYTKTEVNTLISDEIGSAIIQALGGNY